VNGGISFDSMDPFPLARPDAREVVVVRGEEGEVALKACEVVCPEGLERANLEDVACVPTSPRTSVNPFFEMVCLALHETVA
jgi:hypothetical protein